MKKRSARRDGVHGGVRPGRAPAARRSLLGEATLIAGVTAAAYLVSLAYRVGGLMRLQLPPSLATVRLTDAAVAGLVVLVGGFLILLLFDVVESWREGTVGRAWIVMLIGAVSVFLVLTGVFAVAFLITLWTLAGWGWTAAMATLILVAAWAFSGPLKRTLSSMPVPRHNELALARALDRHPAVAGSIMLTVMLCISSFYFGANAISLGRTAYMQTAATNEVVLSLSEDRMILVGIEPTSSDEATLTGSVRVVPLPSTEVEFSTERVRRLNARSP